METVWEKAFAVLYGTGAPGTIRTCDLCLRRAALYPAELRALWRDCAAPIYRMGRFPATAMAAYVLCDARNIGEGVYGGFLRGMAGSFAHPP